MGLNFFQRRKILKKLNYLEATPIRKFEHIIEENGKVTVLIPKFKKEFMRNYFVPRNKSKNINLKLDEFGSETWLLIDGNTNVQQICSNLVEKFGERILPAEERVTKYMTMMYENRLISFKEIQ